MRAVVFTGPSRPITTREREQINGVIRDMVGVDLFISGAAFGVDTIAALAAITHHPEARHCIVVPNGRHNNVLVEALSKCNFAKVEFEVMPDGTNFLDRDQRMVGLSTELCGFPDTLVEVRRSGTWATIRRARKKPIPVNLWPLRV